MDTDYFDYTQQFILRFDSLETRLRLYVHRAQRNQIHLVLNSKRTKFHWRNQNEPASQCNAKASQQNRNSEWR